MKNIIRCFFACMAFNIFFTSCTEKLFPDKIMYNVAEAPPAVSSPAISFDLMKAEAYKNKLNFYYDKKPLGSLVVLEWPPKKLPPRPSPCKKNRCQIAMVSIRNGKYTLTVDEIKDTIILNPVNLDEIFINLVNKTPNQQFILTASDYIKK